MADENKIKNIADKGFEYKAGFNPDIASDVIDIKGINEDVIRYISKKNGESEKILKFRLDAFYKWQKMNGKLQLVIMSSILHMVSVK